MTKQTLQHQPPHDAYHDILKKFFDSKPLSCDQLNFLRMHEKILSNPHLDPVLKYYLKHRAHHHEDHSFLLPSNQMDKTSVDRLNRRLTILLKSTQHAELRLKPEKFLQFRALTQDELIFYHGNQLLTGAPFIQGGIPQLIYFQWGNLFGVAKYALLPEETALNANILVNFELMQERQLKECVYAYERHLLAELKPEPTTQITNEPQPEARLSPFAIPTLNNTPIKQQREDE